MVHLDRRFVHVRATDNFGRNPGDGAVRGNIRENDTARPNLGPLADLDIAQDFGPRPDQHPAMDFGVAVSALLARPTKRDLVQNETMSSTTAVSPMTTPVPWSMKMLLPIRAAG